MNAHKHPRFIKNLHDAHLLLSATDAVSEALRETLVFAGFNLGLPIETIDGCRVRLLVVDPDHQFPIVGEVIDFAAETTWLGRWSASGVYASEFAHARSKHSLVPNCGLGERFLEPECECGTAAVFAPDGSPIAWNIDLSLVAEIREIKPAAGYGKSVPQSLREAQFTAFNGEHPGIDDEPAPLRPTPQDGSYSGSLQGLNERWMKHFEEVNRRFPPCEAKAPAAEAPRPGPQEAPATGDEMPEAVRRSLLDCNPNVHSKINASAEIIRLAKENIPKWTALHNDNPTTLREITERHVNFDLVDSIYLRALKNGALSLDAFTWGMAGFLAIAGRLRVYGHMDTVVPHRLGEAVGHARSNPHLVVAHLAGPTAKAA